MEQPKLKVWECQVGGFIPDLPPGSDGPMRQAISNAYFNLTGQYPEFLFSGWGRTLTDIQRKAAYPNVTQEKAQPSEA